MKIFKYAIALASASVLLSACGGSSNDDDTTPTATPTPTPTVSCNDGLPSFVTCTDGTGSAADVYVISGNINEDYTLDYSSSKDWRISGTVTVGSGNVTTVASDADVMAVQDAGVTLTIEPGVHVKAFESAKFIVTRGSKLDADGTAALPITFSSLDDNYDGEGEWGGVVVQGFAPQYGKGNTGACFGDGTTCNVDGEGGDDIGVYGGNIVDDNSGTIRYVRIAEGGLIASADNEVNGLTLQGVGSDTVVEYVQVHGNQDDGIEWFGGTVNVKHVVLTNNDDDDIDFDEGYVGNIQYALVVKNQTKAAPTGKNDPRGIEANSSDADYVPQTNAVLSNITVIGGSVNNAPDSSEGEQPGMRLRGSLTVNIVNSVVEGFDKACIRIDDSDIDGSGAGTEMENSNVTLTNVLGDCEGGYYQKRAADAENNATATTVTFDAAYAINEASAQLDSVVAVTAVGSSSFTFDSTDYVGAVAPGTDAADAWWAGWTLPGTLTEAETETPAAADFVSCDGDVCTINGNITTDYTLVNGVEWRLSGTIAVGNGNTTTLNNDDDVAALRAAGVTLTVRPGVEVLGFESSKLIITRGSKIMAEGKSYAPITFASLDEGYEGEGEWGGIVVQGLAPQYGKGNTGACYGDGTTCNVDGEGGDDIGVYGGNDKADDSGVLKFVRIAEAGLVASADNEVNGLTFQGVGHGTEVEYIQIHGNRDDGIEWFGGTVNVKYAVLTSNDDDDIDFDEGYMGNIQYALIVKNQTKDTPTGKNDPRGIEANSSDADYVPQTNAVLANITVIGGPVNNNADSEEGQQPGMRLRGALTVAVHNTVVEGFDKGCIRIDDADIDGSGAGTDMELSSVTLNNVLGDCSSGYYQKRAADSVTNAGPDTTAVSFDAAYALEGSEAMLDSAATITAMDNGSDFSFDQTDYVGAVKPGTAAADAWWAGWTLDGTL
ncbi:hypothetical protein [Teredinibacter waterburyi]|uniref:hypothetical protein n=1 Tax=Teredinibacter waterburyi TaxID=1500538 RepID=UPI00166004B5|nr:hypothetical protein [Teredinibacter waterburyi]